MSGEIPERPERGNQAELLISVEEFMRTRDNVVLGLTTLQSAVGDLLRAYLRHTTAVLGGMSGSAELDGVAANILENARPLDHGATLGALEGAGDDKQLAKRKQRRKKDPDAPKAPPTAYFLFASSSRADVKADLGEDAKGDVVTIETSNRWKAMSDAEKQVWKDLYKENWKEYKIKLDAFNAAKAAHGEGAEPADEESTAPEVDALQAAAAAQASDDESDSDSSSDSESESSSSEDEAPPPPPPVQEAKKRPAAKKAAAKPAPAAAAAPAPAKPADRKRKEVAKDDVSEEPKKKKSKSGRPSEAAKAASPEKVPTPPPAASAKKEKRKSKSKA